MRPVTDAEFEAEVLRAAHPVVVDFWAPWCGPCKAVGKIMEELERVHGDRVAFVKVNIDDDPEFAARFGVLALPTTILFAGGEPQERVAGARGRSHYERVWARWLGDATAS